MSEEVKVLNEQINVLKDENATLKKRLDIFEKVTLAKVDSATLITSIQRDLLRVHEYAMSQERATTYVLSDFSLQLKGVVTQEADKTMIILPSKPGEIDPNTMSLININLKPIPLQVSPTKPTRPVESIEGIGPVIAGKLRENGISTVTDLALASTQDVVKAGVSKAKASEFIGMAKLMVKGELAGVEGVDEQAAELLVMSAKIDSREKLAETSPDELLQKVREAIESKQVRVPRNYQPTIDDVKRWVSSAKAITDRLKAS